MIYVPSIHTKTASTYLRKSLTVIFHQLLQQEFNLEGLGKFILPVYDQLQQILKKHISNVCVLLCCPYWDKMQLTDTVASLLSRVVAIFACKKFFNMIRWHIRTMKGHMLKTNAVLNKKRTTSHIWFTWAASWMKGTRLTNSWRTSSRSWIDCDSVRYKQDTLQLEIARTHLGRAWKGGTACAKQCCEDVRPAKTPCARLD